MKISHAFVRFLIVGALGFVVDVAVLFLAAPSIGWYGARAMSFWAAASFTWLLNRSYTFTKTPTATKHPVWAEYVRYLVSMLAGGAVNYGVYAMALLTSPERIAPLIGVALGSAAGLIVNYLSARYFVFGQSRSQ